jgi:hypothetical protein
MGRVATWAAVLAVALVVGAAALDTIRGGDEPPRPARTTAVTTNESPEHRTLVRQLVSIGANGRLVTTDERCAVHAYALPSLRETSRPAALDPACAFSLSPDGRRAVSSGADWSPDGRFVAVCRGTVVGVYLRREVGDAQQAWDGCTPAWRPDGVLTLVRRGALLAVRPGCAAPPCERVLLSRAALRRASARHPGAPATLGLVDEPEVEDVVWLTPTRVAVLLGARFRTRPERPLDLLAIFERGRLAATAAGDDDHLTSLVRSPLGTYVAAEPDALFREDGTRLPLDRIGVHALAFSPDETLIALAAARNVLVFPLDLLARGAGPLPAEVPLTARDLAWR